MLRGSLLPWVAGSNPSRIVSFFPVSFKLVIAISLLLVLHFFKDFFPRFVLRESPRFPFYIS